MSTSPQMKSIQEKLRRLGYDVRTTGAKLTVKLPLSCSVEISEDSDVLKTQPIFGYVSRTAGTYIDLCLPLAAFFFWTFAWEGDSKFLLLLVVTAIAAWICDAYRYILTESFITRFQMLVLHGLEVEGRSPEAVNYRAGAGGESMSQAPVIEVKLRDRSERALQPPKTAALRTNLIVTCPECGTRVLPKADGTCPSCQADISVSLS